MGMGCALQDPTVRWMVECHSEDKHVNHVLLLPIEHWSALLPRTAFKHLLLSSGCVHQVPIRSVFPGYSRNYKMRKVLGDLSPKALHLLAAQRNQIPFCAYFAHHNHRINISLHFALNTKPFEEKFFKDFDRLPLCSTWTIYLLFSLPEFFRHVEDWKLGLVKKAIWRCIKSEDDVCSVCFVNIQRSWFYCDIYDYQGNINSSFTTKMTNFNINVLVCDLPCEKKWTIVTQQSQTQRWWSENLLCHNYSRPQK